MLPCRIWVRPVNKQIAREERGAVVSAISKANGRQPGPRPWVHGARMVPGTPSGARRCDDPIRRGNPKFEVRNTKQIGNSKAEKSKTAARGYCSALPRAFPGAVRDNCDHPSFAVGNPHRGVPQFRHSEFPRRRWKQDGQQMPKVQRAIGLATQVHVPRQWGGVLCVLCGYKAR